MAQQKDKQEKASIATFYYAIAKGSSLEPEEDDELKQSLLKIYPAMDAKWYVSFLKQARALIKYLGHSEGSVDNSYLYAWYDGTPEEIPSSETTTLINTVWDKFTSQQKRIFGSKKDSWNTVDVYMVKKSEEQKLKKIIENLEKEFNSPGLSPEIFIGTINAMMASSLKKKELIPISLKQVTSAASEASLKETNVDVGPDKLEVKEASIKSPLTTFFEITNRGGNMDFNTNSLTTNLEFTSGKYFTPYFWETRMSGANQKTELKDLVQNKKRNYIKSAAQAGSIPVPLMKELVREFGGQNLDAHLGSNLSESDKKYWKDYLTKILNDKTVDKKLGNISFNGKKVTPDEFIDKAFSLDAMKPADVRTLYKASKSDFSAKLRQKLRQLVIIDTFIKSKKDNTLADFIGQSYYRAAKMNLSQADLSGPFIKIS
jgi:hypothetical protein